jgi:hypothetical protein
MAHNWDFRFCKRQLSVSFRTILGSKVGLRFRRPTRMGSSTLHLHSCKWLSILSMSLLFVCGLLLRFHLIHNFTSLEQWWHNNHCTLTIYFYDILANGDLCDCGTLKICSWPEPILCFDLKTRSLHMHLWCHKCSYATTHIELPL